MASVPRALQIREPFHRFVAMASQYMNEANAAVAYLSSDDLKELLNNDEKLEERINGVVSGRWCVLGQQQFDADSRG